MILGNYQKHICHESIINRRILASVNGGEMDIDTRVQRHNI